MNKISICAVMMAFGLASIASAGGESEAASSSARGKYLAGQGVIIPPDQVHVNSYIAGVDYGYPRPEQGVGVTVTTGNQLMPMAGGEALIHIGIQAGEMEFDNLPPMNLAFVIDKSGSMGQADKMGWVKDAFDIFIGSVRNIDYVSLVVFDHEARVVYPSTQMDDRGKRLEFQRAVQRIVPDGGTNLVDGLELGYQQVMANYRNQYTNRVLFLTDGVGDSVGILRMAEMYKDMDINVSTIGVGQNFDLDLMVELAKAGGGSSRFIADRSEMEEIFGSELDRMVVPAVRNLRMSLEIPVGYEVLETWGYNHKITGNKVEFSQATLHHRDYETILVKVKVPKIDTQGTYEIAQFEMSYEVDDGSRKSIEPIVLSRLFVVENAPVSGYSDALVLSSGTMLHFAEHMIRVGQLYYSCREGLDKINGLRNELWQGLEEQVEVSYDSLTSARIEELEGLVRSNMQRAIDITVSSKKELTNARLRLDDTGFDDEIGILDKYIKILGKDMELQEDVIAGHTGDVELDSISDKRSIQDHIGNLFAEMALSMSSRDPGVIAVSGFTEREGKESRLLELLNEMAVVEIAQFDTLKIVERSEIDQIMEEQKLSLSALMDTDKAIEVGNLLAAHYILTGSVIEMPSSVVVFGRIINTESSEIESVAQVIISKNQEIAAML